MSAVSRARAAVPGRAIAILRRVARRPRAWVRATRSHPLTTAVQRRWQHAADRCSLAARAVAGRRKRASVWSQLLADTAALPPPAAPQRSVSIVLIAGVGDGPTAAELRVPDAELVVARATGSETPAAAAARAATTTTGDLICFLAASTTTLEPGWLARLAEPIDGSTVVAATPLSVHPLRRFDIATPDDGAVRAAGYELGTDADAPIVRALGAGSRPTASAPPVMVGGASGAYLLVDRRAYTAAGSLPDLADLDLAGFELCRKLRAQGGEIAAVPAAVVVDHRRVDSATALTAPISTRTSAWRSYVEAHGPELMRVAQPLADGRLRIALTVAAPSEKVASRWGDWHLAQAFADALRRRGHLVRVQTIDHADDLASRACDVQCVVRGLRPVRRTPGQAHVLWVISHPESIATDECDAADLVLVASVRFADALRRRTTTPVEVLLQATDVERFRPLEADPEHTHDVAIVAKSRDVYRAAVADAVAAGLRPAIYGSGWETFVDPALVVREYVPNEELPRLYSSVGVLLNDHWQTMRDWGFVSNRLFDALACGTPVISEDLPELDEMFAGTVLTYRDVNELRALVAATLADRVGARERATRGRQLVLEHHTFDHRAAEFLDALHRHGIG